MNKILKKFKWFWSLGVVGFLSLVLVKGVKAVSAPYGVPRDAFAYGVSQPTIGITLLNFLPFIASVFLVFVIAPIVGLIWYRKRGGTKKWPSIVVWTLSILFTLALIALIIFLITT